MVNHTSPWINRAEGSGAESTQISFAGKSFPDGQQGTTGDSDSSTGLPKDLLSGHVEVGAPIIWPSEWGRAGEVCGIAC